MVLLIPRAAATLGGGNFVVGAQRVTDFYAGVVTPAGALPSGSYRLGATPAPLHELYAPRLTAAFKTALERFDRRIPGFLSDAGVLYAAETRTSAPVRVDREGPWLESPGIEGLHPCGEGAGFAGGIVSSAVDGMRAGLAAAAAVQGGAGEARAEEAATWKVPSGY
jgi:uncharacterized FAD-dependent dehydrogenase